jgi:hypothetical protein
MVKACLNGCNIVQHCWTNNGNDDVVLIFRQMLDEKFEQNQT